MIELLRIGLSLIVLRLGFVLQRRTPANISNNGERKAGKTLAVKNMSRQRGIPIFLFFLSEKGSDRSTPFHDIDEVAAALEGRP